MTDEIRIDSLWTLRHLGQSYSQWSLYINQIALFKIQALRDAFYNSGRPDLKFDGNADLLAQVRVLVREVMATLPAIGDIEGFTPMAVLSALTHWPSGEWAGAIHQIEDIQWTRELTLGNRRFGSGTDQGLIKVRDLSEVAQASIRRLDVLTVETAYRRHYKDLVELKDLPTDKLPPPKKVRIFVAYRRTHLDAAKALHGILEQYANSTVFIPYLDYHDMRTGDWFEQLLMKIADSDVFMPLVSNDYAEAGTIGSKELDEANAVATKHGISGFFAPIFLNDQKTDAAESLKKYDGLVLTWIIHEMKRREFPLPWTGEGRGEGDCKKRAPPLYPLPPETVSQFGRDHAPIVRTEYSFDIHIIIIR